MTGSSSGSPKGGPTGVVAAQAVAMALALLLVACGKTEETAAPAAPAETGGPLVATQGEPARPVQGQPNIAAPVPTGGQLDTAGWVLQPPFQAGGQEPYWRLAIEDGWFVFRRSGLPVIEAPMLQPKKDGAADVFESPPLTVTMRRQACETVEGGRGDVSATVTFDDVTYDGCAFGGQQASGASEAAESVAESIRAVDACLAKAAEPALVVAIYPREGGRTAAALRTKNRTLYECAVEPGGEVAYMDEIEQGASGPWTNSKMMFLRDGVSPDLKCEGAEEVRAGEKLLGRLLAAKCRF